MKDLFTMSVFGKYDGPTITADFYDGRPAASYPAGMLDALKTDRGIRWIVDDETGEILHANDNDPRRGIYWIVSVNPDTVRITASNAATMDHAKSIALAMLDSTSARPESLYIAKLPALYNGQPDARQEPAEQLQII